MTERTFAGDTKPSQLPDLMRRRTLLALLGSGLLAACGGGDGGTVSSTCAVDLVNPALLPSPEGDIVIFEAKDPSNPLSIFRVPITRRMQKLAEDLSCGTRSHLEAIERFMTYIDGFAVGVASAATPDMTVIERVGACGTYSQVLLALARCIGIPGRYIGLYNYPVNDGHTTPELYIDGKWMLFDPTTHVYYAETDSEGALPLSYEETLARYQARQPVLRVGQNSRAGRDSYSGPAIFLNANPQGVIGPDKPMRYPLGLDVLTLPELSELDFGAEHQGASYIGAAGVNNEQIWTLSSLTPGRNYRFTLAPGWLGGDLTVADLTFRLSTELVGGTYLSLPLTQLDFPGGTSDVDFVVEFTAVQTTAILTLSHPYRGPGFRYVWVFEYRLELLPSA